VLCGCVKGALVTSFKQIPIKAQVSQRSNHYSTPALKRVDRNRNHHAGYGSAVLSTAARATLPVQKYLGDGTNYTR